MCLHHWVPGWCGLKFYLFLVYRLLIVAVIGIVSYDHNKASDLLVMDGAGSLHCLSLPLERNSELLVLCAGFKLERENVLEYSTTWMDGTCDLWDLGWVLVNCIFFWDTLFSSFEDWPCDAITCWLTEGDWLLFIHPDSDVVNTMDKWSFCYCSTICIISTTFI